MIYLCRLQNWPMQEQCTVCLNGNFRGDLLLQISFSRGNKSLTKINCFTVLNAHRGLKLPCKWAKNKFQDTLEILLSLKFERKGSQRNAIQKQMEFQM